MLLALGVWASALVPVDWLSHDTQVFRVRTGSASELAEAIRQTPRACVYVDEPVSTFSARGRLRFLAAGKRLAHDHGSLRVRFFMIEREFAEDTRAWLDGLRDERVDSMGRNRRMRGYGGLIWLEHGRVVDADDRGGYNLSDSDMEERTLALWNR